MKLTLHCYEAFPCIAMKLSLHCYEAYLALLSYTHLTLQMIYLSYFAICLGTKQRPVAH